MFSSCQDFSKLSQLFVFCKYLCGNGNITYKVTSVKISTQFRNEKCEINFEAIILNFSYSTYQSVKEWLLPKRDKQNIHLLVQQEWSGPKPHNQPQRLEQANKLLHTTFIKFSTKISNLDISIYKEISLIKSIVNIINNGKKINK